MKMESIHSDILENILTRLPIEAALHAKRVCTTWRAILRPITEKPGFLFAHSRLGISKHSDNTQLFYEDEYNHYDHTKINNYYTYNTLTKIKHCRFLMDSYLEDVMVGSCNGLVCFGRSTKHAYGTNPFLITNPLTREAVFLPEYNYSELPRTTSCKIFSYGCSSPDACLASGFGFCPLTNNYKVVTVYFSYHSGEHKAHVQVYTVGGEWRYVGSIDRYYRYTIDYSAGIHANGALYWLRYNNDLQESEILAFDLEGEKFQYIQLPFSAGYEDLTYKDHSSSTSPLKLLGGNNNLYLVHTNNEPFRIDIWVYKRNDMGDINTVTGKNSSCWIKEFSIQPSIRYCIKPFAITRSNKVLLWYKHNSPSARRLHCYDPNNTSTLIKLSDHKAKGMKCFYIEAIPYIHSIVSLKDLGEKNVSSIKDLTEVLIAETRKVKRGREKKSRKWTSLKRSKNCSPQQLSS